MARHGWCEQLLPTPQGAGPCCLLERAKLPPTSSERQTVARRRAPHRLPPPSPGHDLIHCSECSTTASSRVRYSTTRKDTALHFKVSFVVFSCVRARRQNRNQPSTLGPCLHGALPGSSMRRLLTPDAKTRWTRLRGTCVSSSI